VTQKVMICESIASKHNSSYIAVYNKTTISKGKISALSNISTIDGMR
jgi:hypothetical protein